MLELIPLLIKKNKSEEEKSVLNHMLKNMYTTASPLPNGCYKYQ